MGGRERDEDNERHFFEKEIGAKKKKKNVEGEGKGREEEEEEKKTGKRNEARTRGKVSQVVHVAVVMPREDLAAPGSQAAQQSLLNLLYRTGVIPVFHLFNTPALLWELRLSPGIV